MAVANTSGFCSADTSSLMRRPLATSRIPGWYIGMGINGPSKPEYEKEAIAEADFPQEAPDGIRARGQALKIVSKYDQPGYWIGIQIDPQTRKLMGAGSPLLPALVEGY